MILEAFSRVLQSPENQGRMPEAVLYDWLSCILLEPAAPQDHTAQIIHAEIVLLDDAEIEDLIEEAYLSSDDFETLPTAYNNQGQAQGSGDLSQGLFAFAPRTDSGKRLLKTLISFCQSYDHWQFSRWLHQVNASDFCRLSEHE